LTGTYRDGFHAAPRLAELGARLILDGRDEFPEEFHVHRRPHSVFSVEESIAEFVDQMVGAAYEYSTRLSRFMSHRSLEDIYRPMAVRLYEEWDLTAGLHPDIVNYLLLTAKSPDDVKLVRDYLASAA